MKLCCRRGWYEMQAIDNYRRRLQAQRGADIPAQIRKRNDLVMEGAWFRDPETVRARIYKHKEGTRGFEYEDVAEDYVRLIKRTVQENVSTDVDLYMQFRPGVFYPVGSYVDTLDIYPDENGNETWTTYLITNREDSQQFTMFNVLPCNYLFKFVNKNKVYQSLGVVRSLNSYSAGLTPKASTILVPSDMKSLWIPSDDCSMILYYNKRVIVSDSRRVPPLTWSIAKVDDMSSPGVSKYSLVQAAFNPERDWDEKWGYIADIHSDILIDDPPASTAYNASIILYTGSKSTGSIVYKEINVPQIRFGSYVKLSPKFEDDAGNPISGLVYQWFVNDLDITAYTDMIVDGDNLLFKINRDYKLGGKIFSVTCRSDDGSYETEKEFEIIVM